KTFRMEPYQNTGRVSDISFHEGHMFGTVNLVAVDNGFIHTAVNSWENLLGNPFNQTLVAQPIGNQSGDRDNLNPSPFGQVFQIRQQGKGPVVFKNLTDHAGRFNPP